MSLEMWPMQADYVESYYNHLIACLKGIDRHSIESGVDLIRNAWLRGGRIFTLGNGGSALTALHFITDWNKMVFLNTGKRFNGCSLVDNVGLMTAYANDLSYADVFSEQITSLASPEDLVIAISGSGNSENVVRAVHAANKIGCETLGLCGFSGGRLKEYAKHVIWVEVHDMQIVEDAHSIFGHIVMKRLCGHSSLQAP